jgi:hypothetical protein
MSRISQPSKKDYGLNYMKRRKEKGLGCSGRLCKRATFRRQIKKRK